VERGIGYAGDDEGELASCATNMERQEHSRSSCERAHGPQMPRRPSTGASEQITFAGQQPCEETQEQAAEHEHRRAGEEQTSASRDHDQRRPQQRCRDWDQSWVVCEQVFRQRVQRLFDARIEGVCLKRSDECPGNRELEDGRSESRGTGPLLGDCADHSVSVARQDQGSWRPGGATDARRRARLRLAAIPLARAPRVIEKRHVGQRRCGLQEVE
jgi:hypothetical protein